MIRETVNQVDLPEMLRAIIAAGLTVDRIEVAADGKIVVIIAGQMRRPGDSCAHLVDERPPVAI